MKRTPGYVPCDCPATPEPHQKRVGDLLCRAGWFRLPQETQRRLKLSGGSGRPNPVIRFMELRQQLADGVPLEQIEVRP